MIYHKKEFGNTKYMLHLENGTKNGNKCIHLKHCINFMKILLLKIQLGGTMDCGFI